MAFGAQAIAQDEFSKCFAQEPRNTILSYLLQGLKAPVGFLGVLYRLAKLIGSSALFFAALPVVLRLKSEKWRRLLFRFYCKAFLSSWGAQIKRHGRKPKLDEPYIFVSNHTSFIDYLILSADRFPHATVAQRHNGLIGWFQKHILALNGSLVFERAQKNDRIVLAKKMKDHVSQPSNSPLLIFPEGTCVNNEYTVLFHKGAFELGAVVAPVAIKYDKSWADAYWHTKTQTFTLHLLYLMTRWKLVAEVWYLPPRKKQAGQTAVEFANEVKAEISKVAGLKNLSWDGYWKNFAPTPEKLEKLKEDPRQRYSALLLSRSKNTRLMSRRSSFDSDMTAIHHQAPLEYTRSEIEWVSQTTVSTSIRNQVLVSLQEQARKDLITSIKEKRSLVVNTWKKPRRPSIAADTVPSQSIDGQRLENISWRLWFKDNLVAPKEKKPEPYDFPTTVLDAVSSLLPRISSHIYSPQDYYTTATVPFDDHEPLSPRSPNGIKRMFFGDDDDAEDDA
ncbi:hypothetical protein HDV03_005209 [Kappamyces sp. JEL0829]|nr:hypothetical protein HDV03_005209 [Kappamyces sp. JEL0829]